jgi:hypothetical protein
MRTDAWRMFEIVRMAPSIRTQGRTQVAIVYYAHTVTPTCPKIIAKVLRYLIHRNPEQHQYPRTTSPLLLSKADPLAHPKMLFPICLL